MRIVNSGYQTMSVMVMTAIALGLVLSYLGGTPARAQEKTIAQYVHHVWKAEDGLPQNTAQGITQTRDGYLWFATQEGLARFDGARFKVFDKKTSPLKHNFITVIAASQDGSLWVGTRGAG